MQHAATDAPVLAHERACREPGVEQHVSCADAGLDEAAQHADDQARLLLVELRRPLSARRRAFAPLGELALLLAGPQPVAAPLALAQQGEVDARRGLAVEQCACQQLVAQLEGVAQVAVNLADALDVPAGLAQDRIVDDEAARRAGCLGGVRLQEGAD